MSLFSMTIAEPSAATAQNTPHPLARFARPLLGLVLPVGLALAWEIAVRMGWAQGRLVPPPSVIYNTFVELSSAGELQRHAMVTSARVAAGFGIGVVAGTLLGAITGYS